MQVSGLNLAAGLAVKVICHSDVTGTWRHQATLGRLIWPRWQTRYAFADWFRVVDGMTVWRARRYRWAGRCTEPTVVKWRRQYAKDGLAGLEDAKRPGGPRRVLTERAISEILSATVTPPSDALRAAGVMHWSSRRLAG